jgi:hypothetical protein
MKVIKVIAVAVVVCASIALPRAQGRGGGGSGSSGGGASFSGMQSPTRLAMLGLALQLTEAQKKDAKTTLDAAFKEAAPLRAALTDARAPIGPAIQAGHEQAELDRDVSAYAAQAAAMAGAEMKALAKIVHSLSPEQQANASALTTAAYLMRGAFLGKKWDTAPDLRFY